MKKLYRGAVGTGSGTLLYVVPKEFRCEIQDITISNTTAAPIRFKMHIVASGGSPSTANLVIPDVSINGNTFIQWTGTQTMNVDEFIQGIGSAAGITVTITGDEHR